MVGMKPGQFSLSLLLVETALIAAALGFGRQAVVSHSPAFLIPALLALGAAFGPFRLMVGAREP